MSQHLGQNIAQVCIHNWSQLAGSEYVQLHSTVSICSYIQPTNLPTNLPTYLPTYQPTNEPPYKLEMQLRLFSQKSKKKTGIPSPIFGWKNNEKPRYTTVSYGFLMFLVDFYFKCWRWPEAYPGRQLWGGLVGSLSAAVASFVNWKGRFVGSPLSSEPKTCVCCFFFNCIQSQFIGLSFCSCDCSWRPVEFGRNRNNNTQDYILRYLSYIQ